MTYLSWPFAWGELKKIFPNATYTIYENSQGWNYFTDGRTCWVKTGVTVEDIEHIEYLPVMDYRNKSITVDNITSFDVNKAIQRSLTKAAARHGLGLYIYAGEDLPEESTGFKSCEMCGEDFKPMTDKNGKTWTPVEIYLQMKLKSPNGRAMCKKCLVEYMKNRDKEGAGNG